MSANGTPLVYTGGDLATHAYLLPLPKEGSFLCFDAPEGLAEAARKQGWKIDGLILTHGHYDHIWDAAAVAQEHGCRVWIHPADAPMMRDPSVFFKMGLLNEPLEALANLEEIQMPSQGASSLEACGETFQIFHIPGHSPGSVAFYHAPRGLLIGGDVLFAGGVGRWDLPGGSRDSLLNGIKKHLLPLPAETMVYPGHGPATTIGAEKETNPYL